MLNLVMQRPCVCGGALRALVVFKQHHVAQTTHHHSSSPGWLASRPSGRAESRGRDHDCSVAGLGRQQPKSMESSNTAKRPPNVPTWQRWRVPPACGWLVCLVCVAPAHSQIYDSLDTHPPRWHLAESDSQARVIDHGHLATGGVGAGACETITIIAGHGTEALLVYPIEPALPIDDLRANVSIMSAKEGARIGLRVRYPYLRDRETRQAASVVIYGASYHSAGEFASIGVGLVEKPLRLKNVALRNEYGSDADLSDPYVDGIIINAYSGPGTTSIRLDELRINGLIPVEASVVTGNARGSDGPPAAVQSRRPSGRAADRYRTAFTAGKIVRILQHNDEPLSWIRSLGFDAVLLSKPPDAAILSEAIRARMLVYAPPPSSPDPALESMLEPVAGWYIGSGEAMDSRHIEKTALAAKGLRGWPQRWQRPIIGAPSESWRHYAPLIDGIIDDLPPRTRGLQASEELAQMLAMRREIGDRVEFAVGLQSMPPTSLLLQNERIADAIGSPRPVGFRWHSMWLQAFRSLETTPSAILFRSTRSLASGSPLDSQRSMALSYVNRLIATISPWICSATPMPPPTISGAPIRPRG